MRKFAHSHTLKQQVVHGFSYSYPWKELRCPTLEHSKCRERMLSWADISNSSPCKEAVRSHQNWQTRPIWLLWYFEAPGHKAATDATDDATPNLAVFKSFQKVPNMGLKSASRTRPCLTYGTVRGVVPCVLVSYALPSSALVLWCRAKSFQRTAWQNGPYTITLA